MAKYINRLSKDDIEQILIQNNYILFENNIDENTKEKIEPIQRCEDNLFIRCIKVPKLQELKLKNLLNSYGNIPDFLNDLIMEYGEIIFIEDFYIHTTSTFVFNEENDVKLLKSYINFMKNKFGDEYEKDFNNFVNSLPNNNQENQPSL